MARRVTFMACSPAKSAKRKSRNASIPAQLTFVSTAIEPDKPTQTSQVALYAVAGMIGLILGVIVALWSGLRDAKTHQPQQPALV